MPHISKSRLTALIKKELKEIIDLPSDLTTNAGPEEERMDALSKSWEELITARILNGETGIWSNTDVIDPIDGERRALDEFLAILGNYVVSDEIDEGTARDLVKAIANQISDNLFEPSPHEWGIPLPKWENMPGFEPQDELQEGGRAGHYKGVDVEDVGASTAAEERELLALLGGRSDDLTSALQATVAAWTPETSEGEQYEEDILNILERFKSPELQEASRKARDAAARRRRQKREEDPKYKAVKKATEKHLEKAKKEREEKEKKAKEKNK